jgi:glycosyltransferase involved in cell wall biosynthesis
MAKIGLDLRFWRSRTGGLGRYSRNLLRELLQLDKENSYTAIITPDDEAEFELEASNLTKLVVPIPHFSLAEQRHLPKILNEQNFDLVHFANFNHPITYKRPFVITVHDLIMHLYPSGAQQRSVLRRLAYKWVMNDCRRARAVIVPSRSTENDLVKVLGFPESKIVVTEEAAEPSFHPATESEKVGVRQKFNLPERYLIFVSRWERYKGLPALLEAYQSLRADFPDLGLVICGMPDKQNQEVAATVRAAQQNNPKIITPGFVTNDELVALYGAASTYVHPSWYEGFGIMILEAFACGVPVVTSNNSSLPEVAGDAAMLIDPRNPAAIAAATKQILSDDKLAQELVNRGLERVKQYSWRRMAGETLQVYKKALRI